MRKIILVLLACAVAIGSFAACSGSNGSSSKATPDEAATKKTEQTNETSQPEETALPKETAETDPPMELYSIETKYATLKFPKKYKDDVNVKIDEKDPYTVSFTADDVLLFSLSFNGGDGDVAGTIVKDNENVVVRINMPELDSKAKNYDKLSEYQEQSGVLLTELSKDYNFVNGIYEDESEEVYEIKTDLTSLYYPKKWQDKVKTEVSSDKVKFYCGKTPLFDIVFGDGEGTLVGTYDGKKVLIVDHKVTDDEMANMQEDVNVILEYLRKDDKYKEAAP